MKRIISILLITLLLLSYSKVYASGPLYLSMGAGLTYGTNPMVYRYDQGTLGMFSNSEAVSIIESLFSEWESVPTASITFQQDLTQFLTSDINSTNFSSVLNPTMLLGYSPVVFDTDGSIIEALVGAGSGNHILGFAGAVFGTSTMIVESQALFNGKFVNGISSAGDPESTLGSFKGTVLHEFGHAIGLDHSQINVDALNSGAPQSLRDLVPLMFPIAVNDLFSILRDDISSASYLYPNTTALTNYGRIDGKVFRSDGTTPVLGANVVLRDVNNPLVNAISCVSDFLKINSGSFTFFAVPPGSYRVEIEPIYSSFTGGSSVGPYSGNSSDSSFINPVPKGYYTGANQQITSDINMAFIINISAGSSVQNINIIAELNNSSSSSSGSTSSSSSGSTSSSSGSITSSSSSGSTSSSSGSITSSSSSGSTSSSSGSTTSSSSSGSTSSSSGSTTSSSSSGSTSSSSGSITSSSSSGSTSSSSGSTTSSSSSGSSSLPPGGSVGGGGIIIIPNSTPSATPSATPTPTASPSPSSPPSPSPLIPSSTPIPTATPGTTPLPSSTPSSEDNLDFLTNPRFPSVIELPLTTDFLSSKVAFAFSGSNPSFEVKLKNKDIKSIEIKDSNGITFQNVGFMYTKILNESDKYIISLFIPNNISIGDSKLTINYADGKTQNGIVRIVDFINVTNKKGQDVPKPIINRVLFNKAQDTYILKIRGGGFVGGSKDLNVANTISTIFPSNLNISTENEVLSKDGKNITLKFMSNINFSTNLVITIVTPRGIVSKSFILKR